jgi:hypothetical protein
MSMVFYFPLAIVGFNTVAFVLMSAIQLLYQFWIHTKTIKKLPRWFEFIFNTPSHHRVHHGVNPKYIDRNHGGTLIIFDRIFGTFQEEEEEVVYGVTKPLATWSPIWANFDYYRDLWNELKKTRNFTDKLKMLWNPPGWRPDYMGGPYKIPEVQAQKQVKYDPAYPVALNYYLLVQYVLVPIGASVFLFQAEKLSLIQKIVLAAPIILATANFGGLLDNKSWGKWSELLRHIGVPILLFFLFANLPNIFSIVMLYSLVGGLSVIWLLKLQV